jgi:hypothetical protein
LVELREFYRVQGQGSTQSVEVDPLPDAAASEEAEHIAAADGVSAEVTRPPFNRNVTLARADPQFRDRAAGDVLPDDDGVEEVGHQRGVSVELHES